MRDTPSYEKKKNKYAGCRHKTGREIILTQLLLRAWTAEWVERMSYDEQIKYKKIRV